MLRDWLLSAILLGFVLSTLAYAVEEPRLARYSFREVHMGTEFKIVLYAPSEELARKAAQAAFKRIAELDGIFSDYKKTSELRQLCARAGGPPVKVSRDLLAILLHAQELSRKTGGAFDVTVGPIVKLWRRARRTRELPDPERLKAALARVGYRNLRIDPKSGTVQLLLEGMMLDLGGIAKGYAADAALEVLRRFGITRALVAASGDIRVGDPPPGRKGWKIGVGPLASPKAPPKLFVSLRNAAVSTSGDLYQFVLIKGKRYSHIVDPKTGLGLLGRSSVTVIAPTATQSDSLATAVSVMPPQAGLKLIEATPGAAAYIVRETDDGKRQTYTSRRFRAFVEQAGR